MDLLQITRESADQVIAKAKKRISDRLSMSESLVDKILDECATCPQHVNEEEEEPTEEVKEGSWTMSKKKGDLLKRIYAGEAEEMDDEDEEEDEEDEDLEEKCKTESIVIENEYQEFFKKMLAQKGVKSPSQLPPNERKEFFKKVKAGWAAKKK